MTRRSERYQQARARGADHEEALAEAGIPRKVDFAARELLCGDRAQAMADAGYASTHANQRLCVLSEATQEMAAGARLLGDVPWLTEEHYSRRIAALLADVEALKVKRDAACALALSRLDTPSYAAYRQDSGE